MNIPSLIKNTCFLFGFFTLFNCIRLSAQSTYEWNNSGHSTTDKGKSPVSSTPVLNATITMYRNSDNPTGNTFTVTPVTATIAIENPVYVYPSATANGLVIGANWTAGTAVYQYAPNYIYESLNSHNSANSNYTSSNFVTPGTGISITNNYAIHLLAATQPLYAYAAQGRYKMATVSITFSVPVTNPIVHFYGIGTWLQGNGGNVSTEKDAWTEFELVDPAQSFTILSGNQDFALRTTSSGVQALTHKRFSQEGTTVHTYDGANGSVTINGNNLTTVKFTVYLRSTDTHSWKVTNGGSPPQTNQWGDEFDISVSLDESSIALPVKLSAFSAAAANNGINLNWTTVSEINNKGFDIEKSTDGKVFNKIGYAASKAVDGSNSLPLTYTFADNAPAAGTNYYRLHQIDIDGTSYTKFHRACRHNC